MQVFDELPFALGCVGSLGSLRGGVSGGRSNLGCDEPRRSLATMATTLFQHALVHGAHEASVVIDQNQSGAYAGMIIALVNIGIDLLWLCA